MTDGPLRSSPAWDPAVRGEDGLMNTTEPVRWRPDPSAELPGVLRVVLAAAFAEATAWHAEMDVTINPEPDPAVPLDFLAIDLDGRFDCHATNATFMAPSDTVSDASNDVLRAAGWQGVATGGPVYKVWDGIALDEVAADLARVVPAMFPVADDGFRELSVNVLAPDDDTGTSYDVVASATRPVLQRAVLASLETSTVPPTPEVWDRACAALGIDPADVPLTDTVPVPAT